MGLPPPKIQHWMPMLSGLIFSLPKLSFEKGWVQIN